MSDSRVRIARRVAKFLQNGDLVNLGIGLPTLVANYLPEGLEVEFQSENGLIGLGGAPEAGQEDQDITNAGAQPATLAGGASCFDSAMSFAVIRGGHVGVTVLGALEVDQEGNLANWIVPGKMVPGMGGAMDLLVGAKEVIVAMEHTAKGNPKILKKCTLPYTAVHCVTKIITEMCVMEVTENGLVMTEINPEFTVDDVKAATEADFTVAEDLKDMTA